jgi:hypothetical protein
MTRPLFVLALTALGGCNPCQEICGRMAAYARDCGYDVPASEVAACQDAQAGDASADDRDVCREFGSRQEIREQWTCDDVAAYFERSGDFERANAEDTGSPGDVRVE